MTPVTPLASVTPVAPVTPLTPVPPVAVARRSAAWAVVAAPAALTFGVEFCPDAGSVVAPATFAAATHAMEESSNSHSSAPPPGQRPKDPLHGVTLEMMLTRLVDRLGWEDMSSRIRIRCFANNPSISSSLKFLRRTPWARRKMEQLYLQYDFPE